jgi:hypothetical protein
MQQGPAKKHSALDCARRQVWQAQIRQLLQDQGLWARAAAAERATAEGVRGLLSTLLGDDSALLAATATWLEYLAAQALHVYPTLRCACLASQGHGLIRTPR